MTDWTRRAHPALHPACVVAALVGLAATAMAQSRAPADSGRFRSLYERVAARMQREPGLLDEHPPSAGQLAAVGWMQGTWSCQGHVFATPTTPARDGRRPEVSTYVVTPMGDVLRTSRDSTGITYRSLRLHFDARAGVWVQPVTASEAWGTMTAPGWRGDTITFAGHVVIMGEPTDLRQTWTRRGPDAYDMLNEERAPAGSLVPLDAYRCTRTKDAAP